MNQVPNINLIFVSYNFGRTSVFYKAYWPPPSGKMNKPHGDEK